MAEVDQNEIIDKLNAYMEKKGLTVQDRYFIFKQAELDLFDEIMAADEETEEEVEDEIEQEEEEPEEEEDEEAPDELPELEDPVPAPPKELIHRPKLKTRKKKMEEEFDEI